MPHIGKPFLFYLNTPLKMNTQVRLAIQKSGRLHDSSLALLRDSGMHISNGKDQLKTTVRNFPIEILFLRDDDIPQYIEDHVADFGIIGENVLAEKDKSVQLIKRLDFAKCRLAIAIPKAKSYYGLNWLQGKNIATSYPSITQKFLDQHNIKAALHEISGSVEIAPSIGLADAICDLVSTGSTLLSNGLQEVETVMQSEAVLVASPGLASEKQKILDQLVFRINAVQNARNNKYILLNCPDEAITQITSVIPGMNSPTIMPLNRKGWSSLHSVVNENDFWEKIDLLKSAGAEGILVIPIEKMIA